MQKIAILFDLCVVVFFTLTLDDKKRFMIFYDLFVLSLKKRKFKSRVLTCGLSGEQRGGKATDYRRAFDRLTGVSCVVRCGCPHTCTITRTQAKNKPTNTSTQC